MQNACLRDECIKILTRLFHLSDTNKDGLLDDDELRRYQAICYGKQLTPDDLHVLKKSVEMNDPEVRMVVCLWDGVCSWVCIGVVCFGVTGGMILESCRC